MPAPLHPRAREGSAPRHLKFRLLASRSGGLPHASFIPPPTSPHPSADNFTARVSGAGKSVGLMGAPQQSGAGHCRGKGMVVCSVRACAGRPPPSTTPPFPPAGALSTRRPRSLRETTSRCKARRPCEDSCATTTSSTTRWCVTHQHETLMMITSGWRARGGSGRQARHAPCSPLCGCYYYPRPRTRTRTLAEQQVAKGRTPRTLLPPPPTPPPAGCRPRSAAAATRHPPLRTASPRATTSTRPAASTPSQPSGTATTRALMPSTRRGP